MKCYIAILCLLLLGTQGYPNRTIDTQISQITTLLNNYQADSAQILLSDLKQKVKKEKKIVYQLSYYELSASFNRMMGDNQTFHLYIDSIMSVINQVKPTEWIDSFYVAKAYNNIGASYDNQFQYDQSLEWFSRALNVTESRPDNAMRSFFYQNAGLSLIRLGRVEEGLKYVNQAFHLYEKHHDLVGKIECADHIATTMVDYRNFDLAKKFYRIAESLLDSVTQPYLPISINNNVGRMYNYMLEYDSALIFFNDALKQSKENKNGYLEAIASSNIGEVLLKKGNYNEATPYLDRGLELFQKYQIDMGIFQLNSLLAYQSFKLNQIPQASQYQSNAEALYNQAGQYPSLMIDFFKRSYEIERGQGHFKKALAYLEQYQTMQDSLNNVMNNWKANELESRLLTSIKEKQLIQKEEQLLRAQKARLRLILWSVYTGVVLLILYWFLFYRSKKQKQLYRMNTRLLDEEHQKGVLQMQLMLIRNRLSPHFLSNLFLDLQQLVSNSEREQALNQLSKLSKLVLYTYTHTDSISVQLQQEIEFVRNYIEVRKYHLGDSFSYTIDMAKETESILIPSLSVQLFVENAIKHGLLRKEGTKELMIKTSISGLFLRIEIIDNGIGRNKAKELETSGSGMGFFILSKVTEQLNTQNINPIQWLISDLKDEFGNATGTAIKIEIPTTYNYQA